MYYVYIATMVLWISDYSGQQLILGSTVSLCTKHIKASFRKKRERIYWRCCVCVCQCVMNGQRQTGVVGYFCWIMLDSWESINKIDMDMNQDLYIPFLEGWTSIYQLFWCELQGYQGFDPLPYRRHNFMKALVRRQEWDGDLGAAGSSHVGLQVPMSSGRVKLCEQKMGMVTRPG